MTALLLLLSPLANSAVWDGTADTAWYTNNKENANFTISTAEQLAGLANLVNGASGNGTYTMSGKTITLGANIELNDTTGWNSWNSETTELSQWTPIGTSSSSFKGTFDWAGFAIRGLYISTSSSYQGLFGFVNKGAIIKNVGVIAGNVSGTGNYVGGLVGNNYSGSTTISNSYYDSQTSRQSDEGNGTPKTTAQMKQQATFAGWDFEHIWVIDEGNDYPKLLLQTAHSAVILTCR